MAILVDKDTGIEYKVLKGELVQVSKLKPVDMDLLIKSSIDCEFKDSEDDAWAIGKLTAMGESEVGNQLYWKQQDNSGCWYYQCRPRLNTWLSIKECPLANVQARLINAGFSVYRSGDSIFIEGTHSAYYYPWEKEREFK